MAGRRRLVVGGVSAAALVVLVMLMLFRGRDGAEDHRDGAVAVSATESFESAHDMPVATPVAAPETPAIPVMPASALSRRTMYQLQYDGEVVFADGRPAPHARVSSVDYSKSVEWLVADDEGRFSHPFTRRGMVWFEAVCDGMGTAEPVGAYVDYEADNRVRLVLSVPALALTGQFVDPTGYGVANVPLWAERVESDARYPGPQRVHTDADGYFIIGLSESGDYALGAGGREHPYSVNGRREPLIVRVGQDSLDVGTLVLDDDDGAVLMGVVETAAGTAVTEGYIHPGDGTGKAFLGAPVRSDGTFRVTGLPADGVFTIAYSPPEERRSREIVLRDVTPAMSPVRVIVGDALSVTIRVVSPGGNPVSNFALYHTFREPREEYVPAMLSIATGYVPVSSPEGQVTLTDLPVLKQWVAVRADGFNGTIAAITPEDDGGEVTVQLKPELRIVGRVTDESGMPVAGAALRLSGDNGYRLLRRPVVRGVARSDGDGRFELRGVVAGTYWLGAQSEIHEPYYEPVTVEPDSDTVEVDVVLRVGGTLALTVTRGGEPVTAAARYTPEIYDEPGMNRTDSIPIVDGQGSLAGLAPGRYVLWITGSDTTEESRVVVAVRSGEVTPVQVELMRGHGVIEGSMDPGYPVLGQYEIRSRVRGPAGDWFRTPVFENRGWFHLEDVPEGQGFVALKSRKDSADPNQSDTFMYTFFTMTTDGHLSLKADMADYGKIVVTDKPKGCSVMVAPVSFGYAAADLDGRLAGAPVGWAGEHYSFPAGAYRMWFISGLDKPILSERDVVVRAGETTEVVF